LSETTVLTSLRSKNIFVGCPNPIDITTGVAADKENGEPGYGDRNISYGGEYAIHHTAAQVKKMNAAGIKTLAYFIGNYNSGSSYESRSKIQFRRMYGASSEFIDTNNLTQLSHSLNKLLIRK